MLVCSCSGRYSNFHLLSMLNMVVVMLDCGLVLPGQLCVPDESVCKKKLTLTPVVQMKGEMNNGRNCRLFPFPFIFLEQVVSLFCVFWLAAFWSY